MFDVCYYIAEIYRCVKFVITDTDFKRIFIKHAKMTVLTP